LLVHRHTQVIQGGNHHFQGFGIDQLVGQVVADFAVGEVAAGLAQFDQGLQALATLLHLGFGQDGFVQAEFLHQGPLFGLADLHAQGLDLFACLRDVVSDRFALQIVFEFGQFIFDAGLGDAAFLFGATLGTRDGFFGCSFLVFDRGCCFGCFGGFGRFFYFHVGGSVFGFGGGFFLDGFGFLGGHGGGFLHRLGRGGRGFRGFDLGRCCLGGHFARRFGGCFGRHFGGHLGRCFSGRFRCCFGLGDGRGGFGSSRLGYGFGLGRGLGRLLRLLSGHGQPRDTKRDKETDTVSAKYIPARAWV